MSMYYANPPDGPIGYQAVEFLDIPPMSESLDTASALDWGRADPSPAERSSSVQPLPVGAPLRRRSRGEFQMSTDDGLATAGPTFEYAPPEIRS